MRWIFLATGLLASLGAPASAADANADLKKLAEEIRTTVGTRASGDVAAGRGNPAQMLVAQLEMAAVGRDAMQLESVLTQIAATVDSPAVRERCAAILGRLQAEREEKEQRKIAEVRQALVTAGEKVRAAKTAADLDATLRTLSAYQAERNSSSGSPEFATELNKVQAATRFVSQWQDYLAAQAAGQGPAAQEILGSISSTEGYGTVMMPRSEILRRRYERGVETFPARDAEMERDLQVSTIISRIQKPEDLAGAMAELNKLDPRREAWSGNASATVNALQALDTAYREFTAGEATQVETISPNVSNVPRLANPVPAVRAQLLLLVLPRYLGLPAGTKASAGETVAAFLKRISAEAAARGDYALAAKADDTEVYLRYGDRNRTSDSQVSFFITGRNQETAGQFALAVGSYQRALAQPFSIVPPRVIGERLAAIKAAQPEEFQKGMDLFLSPPMSPNSMDPMRQRERMMQMSRDGRPQPPARPPLSIPAAKSTPAKPLPKKQP